MENSSYSSVIEDYYEAYNDRDEDKAKNVFPYGSTTTIDFSNVYGEFDTDTIINTHKSIWRYRCRYNEVHLI